MGEWIWLIPALPFAGFLILALAGSRLPGRAVSAIGTGSVGLAALVNLVTAVGFDGPVTRRLWTWLEAGGLRLEIAFHLDVLALVMTLAITGVGFLIHLYSVGYMKGEEGYARFFAYMNLFVGSMLVLVLADNLLLLYLGWEGVGLCSYLLIGFWYRDPANGAAARKAFLVTRIGDTAMAIGLFLIFTHLGTLHIGTAGTLAAAGWAPGSSLATGVALLLLGGAVGKSAQLPLQTWLPDAMAGPTPVSALIHAATMVTAGFYLVARLHVFFDLAPLARAAVGWVGAITLLMAGLSALVQTDIKRVLAWSTISQIGYLFLALGVGAHGAATFHFATHAVFKALLFLGAGAVIIALHHEQDMGKMGGLRKKLPVTFWTFLVGAGSLAALPLVTSGFYSKELILGSAWAAGGYGRWLFVAGVLGAGITGVYTFRMVFRVFFGEAHTRVYTRPGWAMKAPLVVLAVLACVLGPIGFLGVDSDIGSLHLCSWIFYAQGFPIGPEAIPVEHGLVLKVVASGAALAGVALAWWLYLRRPALAERIGSSAAGSMIRRLWLAGWGFDWLYHRLFVAPFVWLARVGKADLVDGIWAAIAVVVKFFHHLAAFTQTGRVRHYAMGIALGVILALALAVCS
jgi:NADH-quinone oxidoreductase subunit L